MAPMTRGFSPDGIPGADVAAYYARRARHGVGLIITEGVGIDHPSAIGSAGLDESDIPVLHGDAALAGWSRVVDEVHAGGGQIFPQLWHEGPMRERGGPWPDAPSSRPSGIWGPPGRRTTVPSSYVTRMLEPTNPMTEAEIAEVIAAFGRSARNAVAVGFDGVAIHGAHGYLIDAFLWDETNHRRDAWGGSIERRTAFATAVIGAVRDAIGPERPILFRYSQWKQQDVAAQLAKTPAELEQLLGPLVDAGVDIFDVSTRRFDTPAFQGSDLTLAGWTRKVTGKTTMCVGSVGLDKELYSSLRSGSEAVNNLGEVVSRFDAGEFDLVGVGRAILSDPEWLLKVRNGEPFLRWNDAARTRLH